jgi:hypothetical protein
MALTYAQITAITTNAIEKRLTDNIFDSNAVLARMKKNKNYKKVDGGAKIQVPLIYQASTSGGAFSDLDALTVSRTDDITAAAYDFRQYYQAVRISGLDLIKASGDSAKLSLIESKIKVAEMSLADSLATGLFSAGTSNKIDGFQAMISASSTYGGIAVADFAGWAAVVKANGAVNRAVSLGLIQQAMGAATEGNEKPTMATCKQNVYDEVWSLFQPYQRIESAEMGELGFKGVLQVNGIPLIVDSHMKANSIFFINENHAYLVVHKDYDMKKQHHESLETTDSMLTKIFWAGNLVCSNRRFQAELADLSVAA